jgi:hypothetical protein
MLLSVCQFSLPSSLTMLQYSNWLTLGSDAKNWQRCRSGRLSCRMTMDPPSQTHGTLTPKWPNLTTMKNCMIHFPPRCLRYRAPGSPCERMLMNPWIPEKSITASWNKRNLMRTEKPTRRTTPFCIRFDVPPVLTLITPQPVQAKHTQTLQVLRWMIRCITLTPFA